MELYDRLAELRRERGLTQDELAREVGVSRQAVSKWERGLMAPATVNLITLAQLYGIPVDELVNEALSPEERAAVAVAEPPEEAPPRKRVGILKILGVAGAAALVLLVATASVITIVSAITKEAEQPEKTEDGFPIVYQDDLIPEDIDLSQVEDWTNSVTIMDP